MYRYYVNDRPKKYGDHIVHREGCYQLATADGAMHLGLFSDCAAALDKARTRYRKINGCWFCCRDCHMR